MSLSSKCSHTIACTLLTIYMFEMILHDVEVSASEREREGEREKKKEKRIRVVCTWMSARWMRPRVENQKTKKCWIESRLSQSVAFITVSWIHNASCCTHNFHQGMHFPILPRTNCKRSRPWLCLPLMHTLHSICAHVRLSLCRCPRTHSAHRIKSEFSCQFELCIRSFHGLSIDIALAQWRYLLVYFPVRTHFSSLSFPSPECGFTTLTSCHILCTLDIYIFHFVKYSWVWYYSVLLKSHTHTHPHNINTKYTKNHLHTQCPIRHVVSIEKSNVPITFSYAIKKFSLINLNDYISVPPMLSIPNQLEAAYQGQDVTLECQTEAYPASINYWTTEKGDMIISGKWNLCIFSIFNFLQWKEVAFEWSLAFVNLTFYSM